MATIAEMIVKLLADTGSFDTSMAEASATVKTSSDAMAASYKSAMQSFSAFDAIQKGSLTTSAEVAAAQDAINTAQATGAFTAEELAAKQALVDAAMLKVGKETEAASGALGLFTRNSRTMYSTSALITDAMTGQFSRMRREVAALGNETGLMAKAFALIASPVGVAVLAVAGLGAAFVEAADHETRFQQTVLSTGNIIGMTAGQLQTMSDDIGLVTGSSFGAVEAVNSIGRSGLFTGEQLRTAAEGAVFFSQVTGENMTKAASVIEQLQDKPKEAIVKLNDQYHFLTQTQAELIVKLLDTGQSAQAAAVAVQAFHDAMADRAQQMVDNTSALSRDWQGVKEWTEGSVEALAEYLNMLGGSKNITDQLNAAYVQLAHDQSSGFKLANPFISQADAIRRDMAVIDALRNKEAQQEAQAQKTAAANKAAAQTLDKGVGSKGATTSATGSGAADEQAFQQAQYAAQQQGHELSLAEQKAWWQKRLATDQAGGAADANAAAAAMRRVVALQKQMDTQAANSGRETARTRANEAKREAQQEEQAAKEAADARHALDEQNVEDSHNLALAKIQTSLADDKLLLAQGKISAAQMVQDQIDALNKQLATDVDLYQAKAKLAAGDAAEQSKWNAAIALDEERTAAKIKAIEAASAAEIKRIIDDIARAKERDDQRMIMSGFREVNAVVGRQETLRQALQNIGMQIVEAEERNIAKSLAQHLAAEQAKTAATIAGNATRVAADQAGQAQSLLVQGEAAVKWIMTEAAKAAAGAFNAMVSIPYIGPILAVGASIAAFATVSKLVGSIASAEGGWERVPADGMQTILHKDEMVLPARIANPMRKMAGGGGAGGAHHYHYTIQAYDRRGLADFVARNGIQLGQGLQRLGRNGHR